MRVNIPKPVGFLILMIFLFALGYLIPYTIVLGKAGLLEPNIARQLSIYSNIFLFSIGLVILYVANLIWKKNDKYGDNIGIFNKDETIFKNYTYGQITILSVIFFSSIFLLVNRLGALGSGLFGLRFLPQQFSPTDSLIVNTLQIPIAENIMAGFTIGLIAIIMTLIAMRFNWDKNQFKIYKISAITVGLAIFGFIWHQTVYTGSDVASLTTAIFWGIGGLISILTGFFIPFLVMHMTNNFFIDFARLYSSDLIFGVTIAVIIGLIALYFFLYRGRLWGKTT